MTVDEVSPKLLWPLYGAMLGVGLALLIVATLLLLWPCLCVPLHRRVYRAQLARQVGLR